METDWLASETVYFNKKTNKVSNNFYDVIDWNAFEWNAEGLRNYLEFGYSVFGHTQVRDVEFLMPNSSVQVEVGSLRISRKTDPAEKLQSTVLSEDEIWNRLSNNICQVANKTSSKVVIPTSGGFDSRILNALYPDKSQILAFTYGNTRIQERSEESVFARELCRRLNIKWEQIPLGQFHSLFEQWDSVMGPAVHAHGMYHLEFYRAIRQKCGDATAYLSGIFGDVWAGTFLGTKVAQPSDLTLLSFSHGLCADSKQSVLKSATHQRDEFWEFHREELQDPRYQTIWVARFKMILISYLLRCASFYGFQPAAPFLQPDIALAMLQLPLHRRENRVWQREWFTKRGVDIENANLQFSSRNTLDRDALKLHPLKPLRVDLLREIIQPRYVEWVNKNVASPRFFRTLMHDIYHLPKLCGGLMRLGIRDQQMTAYNAYLTLWPLQRLIEQRNEKCR